MKKWMKVFLLAAAAVLMMLSLSACGSATVNLNDCMIDGQKKRSLHHFTDIRR